MSKKPNEFDRAPVEVKARRTYAKPRLEVAPLTSVVRGTPAGSAPDIGPGRKPAG